MSNQELLDYVKLQRSIGVPDDDIKKALASAGYEDVEIHHHMTHKLSRPVQKKLKSLNIETQHVMFLSVLTIVLVVAVFIYLSYDFHQRIQDNAIAENTTNKLMEERVNQRTDQIASELQKSTTDIMEEISKTRDGLIQSDNELRTRITQLDTESKERDATLTQGIQDISQKSNTETDRLATQLKKFESEKVDFVQIVPRAKKSVVTIGTFGDYSLFVTAGSGAVINTKGYVVTNYHVIDELDPIIVRMEDDTKYKATVIGYDKDWDLALLKLNSSRNFLTLQWADSGKTYVGEPVIAIGNPAGFESTVSQGIISSLRRYVEDKPEIPYLQTDVAVNRGNSGGPLINKEGKIVGLITMKMVGDGVEGLGFAIIADDAKRISNKIIATQ